VMHRNRYTRIGQQRQGHRGRARTGSDHCTGHPVANPFVDQCGAERGSDVAGVRFGHADSLRLHPR
jgi:hypothetical protein